MQIRSNLNLSCSLFCVQYLSWVVLAISTCHIRALQAMMPGRCCETSQLQIQQCVGFGMGTGMVVNFGTPWYTVYPYRGIAGMLRVNYNLIFLVLKLFFVVVFVAKFIASQCDVTKYGYAIHASICTSYHLSPPLLPHFKMLLQVNVLNINS